MLCVTWLGEKDGEIVGRLVDRWKTSDGRRTVLTSVHRGGDSRAAVAAATVAAATVAQFRFRVAFEDKDRADRTLFWVVLPSKRTVQFDDFALCFLLPLFSSFLLSLFPLFPFLHLFSLLSLTLILLSSLFYILFFLLPYLLSHSLSRQPIFVYP